MRHHGNFYDLAGHVKYQLIQLVGWRGVRVTFSPVLGWPWVNAVSHNAPSLDILTTVNGP